MQLALAFKVGPLTQYHKESLAVANITPVSPYFWVVSPQPMPRSNSWMDMWLRLPYLWQCLVISRHYVISNISVSGLTHRVTLHGKSLGRIRFLCPYLLANQLRTSTRVPQIKQITHGQRNTHDWVWSQKCVGIGVVIRFYFCLKNHWQNYQDFKSDCVIIICSIM